MYYEVICNVPAYKGDKKPLPIRLGVPVNTIREARRTVKGFEKYHPYIVRVIRKIVEII